MFINRAETPADCSPSSPRPTPDVILTVETDEWWCTQLGDALRGRYPHHLSYPLSNGYGMALFSRFELIDPIVRFVVDEAIPSIKTGILLPSGAVIDLYGMHPQPPAPHQSSKERDTELIIVGREIRRSDRPAVVAGRSQRCCLVQDHLTIQGRWGPARSKARTRLLQYLSCGHAGTALSPRLYLSHASFRREGNACSPALSVRPPAADRRSMPDQMCPLIELPCSISSADVVIAMHQGT